MPGDFEVPDREQIEEMIDEVVERLFKDDCDLLALDVNERAVSHRLACYLQQLLPDWHVDCEYNRARDLPKRLRLTVEKVDTDNLEARTVYPDVIVHKRGTDENLLVIEMKKAGNTQKDEHDRRKLRAFRDQMYYRYTLFLKLSLDGGRPGVVCEWLDGGEHVA